MTTQTATTSTPLVHRALSHPYWVSLAVFAALTVSGATHRLARTDEFSSAGSEQLLIPVVLTPGTMLVLAGAVVSAAWFTWAGRAGVPVGRWLPAVVTWLVGALVVPAVLSSPLVTLTAAGSVLAPLEHDASSVVIAGGLVVLALVQRSRSLMIVSLAFALATVICTFTSPQNQLYDLLGFVGVRDWNMPEQVGQASAMLLPGLVLAVGAADSWRRSVADLRAVEVRAGASRPGSAD